MNYDSGKFGPIFDPGSGRGHDTMTDVLLRHNDDVAWDEFDPDAYWKHNYSTLREDDRAIINTVGAYFSAHFQAYPHARQGAGLDIGSGPNLYPALGMLPWVDSVTLTDHSAANVAWLRKNLAAEPNGDAWTWQPFWEAFARFEGYEASFDVRTLLSKRCAVQKASVFEIQAKSYDIGTMFFVAESMTSYPTEFEDATSHFLGALKPGAPFAAAFMDNSEGYPVGVKIFPAVREVDGGRVRKLLGSLGATARVTEIPIPGDDRLRSGYDGMIIAVGTTRMM